MENINTKKVSGFQYSVKFYDEAGMFLSSEYYRVEVPQTEDREDDRDEASCDVNDWAEIQLEENDLAEEYEVTLVDAY